jgi:hypothetical protein
MTCASGPKSERRTSPRRRAALVAWLLLSAVLDWGRLYLAAGFSVFPLPFASKVPTIPWKKFQLQRPTVAMIEKWFANAKANIAIVMGRISENAVTLDFDNPAVARRVFPDLEELAKVTFVERTSKGCHVMFRIQAEPVKTTTLAGRGFALDIKGEGSYICAQPSTHPDGTPYKLLSPDLRIATISRSEFDALLLRLKRRQSALPGLGFSLGVASSPDRIRIEGGK